LHGGGTCKICEFPDERRKIDIGDYYSDDRLIRGELGWQPATPLREGLQKTLDYYREHLPHYV
jgi:UDP-glucose 4-epimerase